RRRHTRWPRDWSSDVCSSDLTVDAATLWPDTVKRGPMVRQVHGLGTLVPEDIRWIPATSQGRVERILLRPGTAVKADNVILELRSEERRVGKESGSSRRTDAH